MKPASFISYLVFLLLLSPVVPAAPAGRSERPYATSVSDARRAAIVSFCRRHSGRKVGNGECWTLANEAFKATGAQRPAGQIRVWGRRLDLRRESPMPGDILECDRTRFSDGSWVSSQHTAVIVAVHARDHVRISEQNYAGKKIIRERDLELSGLRGGAIYIYRPQ